MEILHFCESAILFMLRQLTCDEIINQIEDSDSDDLNSDLDLDAEDSVLDLDSEEVDSTTAVILNKVYKQ